MRKRPPLSVFLLLIVLTAFALRMVRVGELRMWGDEGFSVYSAQRSLAAITFEGAENDPHPPLYYYLLHLYMPLTGSSELALRFFSVFPGTLTVVLVYLLGKRLFGSRTGLIAAAVTAVAPFHIYYSQEIRMYALAILLMALGLYFFVKLLQAESPGYTEQGALWLGLGLVTLLSLYTLYHAALVLLAEGIYLLALLKTRRALFWRWLFASVGAVVVFLPWLIFRLPSTVGHLEERAGHNVQALQVFVARGFTALTVGHTVPPVDALPLALLFLFLILGGLFVAFRSRILGNREWFLIALVATPMIATYPLYVQLPILNSRLFAMSFVPLALLVTRAMVLLVRSSRFFALPLLLVAGITVYSLYDTYFRYDRYNPAAEDYIAVIRAVESAAAPGDVVLFHANWQMGYFMGHYQGPPVEFRELARGADLEAAVSKSRNLWAVVYNQTFEPGENWLAQHAFPLDEQSFGKIRLLSYRAGVPDRGETFPAPVVFDNAIALIGYRLNAEPLQAGTGFATIQLIWRPLAPIAQDYIVSVRLAGVLSAPPASLNWAQEDSQPGGGTLVTVGWQEGDTIDDRHSLRIPAGTPPGDYEIQVVMYESQSGRSARVAAPENRRGETLRLDTVRVIRPVVRAPLPAIPNRVNAEWDSGAVILAGFDAPAGQVLPGDLLSVTLYWQAKIKPTGDYRAVIQLVDAQGKAYAPSFFRPTSDTFPTQFWQAGDTWLEKRVVRIPASAAPGQAQIFIGLFQPDGQNATLVSTSLPTRELEVQDTGSPGRVVAPVVELAAIDVAARTRSFDLPDPKHKLDGTLGNRAKLLGYDLTPDNLKPGGSLALTLYWQSLDPLDERYTVFVHVLDTNGKLIAQSDGEPDGSNSPTTSWLRGQVITDTHQIRLPASLPPGIYSIVVGMYQASTGQRLSADGTNSDRISLTAVQFAQP